MATDQDFNVISVSEGFELTRHNFVNFGSQHWPRITVVGGTLREVYGDDNPTSIYGLEQRRQPLTTLYAIAFMYNFVDH